MHNMKKVKWEWRMMFTHLCPRNQKEVINETFLLEWQSNGLQSRYEFGKKMSIKWVPYTSVVFSKQTDTSDKRWSFNES